MSTVALWWAYVFLSGVVAGANMRALGGGMGYEPNAYKFFLAIVVGAMPLVFGYIKSRDD